MKNKPNQKNDKRAIPGDASSLEKFAQKYAGIFNKLKKEEVELLALIAGEVSDKGILQKLCIPAEDLEERKHRLQKKLSAKNQADYIKFALAFGLIQF